MAQRLVYVFLLLFAITPHTGFYTFEGFLLLSLTVFLVTISSIFSINIHIPRSAEYLAITVSSVAIIAYSISYYGGLYQDPSTLSTGMFTIGFVLMLLLYSLTKRRRNVTKIYTIIICVYVGVATWTIVSSPNPNVDVFVLLSEAPRKLLEGINPYATTYTQVYPTIVNNTFAYLPLSIILLLPSIILFHDPRYTTVAVMVIFALFVRRVRTPNNTLPLVSIAAAILFIPRSFFILEHMYIEPIIAMGFFFSYRWWKTNAPSYSLLMLSTAMLLKLDSFLSFPAFIPMVNKIFRSGHVRHYWIIPVIITFLFILRSPGDFMRNIIVSYTFHGSMDINALISAEKMLGVPTNNSLSLSSWMMRTSGMEVTNVLFYVPVVIALIVSVIIFFRPIKLFSKAWMVLLIMHYVYPHSFFNHYYFIVLMMLLDITDDLTHHRFNISYESSGT